MTCKLQRLLAVAGAAVIMSGCASPPAAPPPTEQRASGEGACAAPTLEAPSVAEAVHPGDEVDLTVENLVALCADTPATSSGMPLNAGEAVEEFDVVWAQNGAHTILEVVEPNDGSPFSIAVSVPGGATPGSASILISAAELIVEVSD